jgi:alanine racemase
MKLELTYSELCSQLNGKSVGVPFVDLIQEVVYDTRKINPSAGLVFFALNGPFRCGESYISAAYDKGVRVFVVHQVPENNYLDASFIVVDDTLAALQMLAKSYRDQLTYPILAIAGSLGKTTVKEWLYHLIAGKLEVFRSPKSYNSQLGVALSLLELHAECDVAIIEAGISMPNEMEQLEQMQLQLEEILLI